MFPGKAFCLELIIACEVTSFLDLDEIAVYDPNDEK
jgi:hypothetical protein